MAATSPACLATLQLLMLTMRTPTRSSASGGSRAHVTGRTTGGIPRWPGVAYRLPESVMLSTVSWSAAEHEGASGWQGCREGRLPGRRYVLKANCVGKADAPVILNISLGAALPLRPR